MMGQAVRWSPRKQETRQADEECRQAAVLKGQEHGGPTGV